MNDSGGIVPGTNQESSPGSEGIKAAQEAHIDTKKKNWFDLELHDKAIIL
jgi:hypothetical protein